MRSKCHLHLHGSSLGLEQQPWSKLGRCADERYIRRQRVPWLERLHQLEEERVQVHPLYDNAVARRKVVQPARIRYSSCMPNLRLDTGRFALLVMTSMLSLTGCKDENVDVSGYVDAWSKKVCDAVVECNCDYPGGSQYDHCISQLSVGANTQAEILDVRLHANGHQYLLAI